MKKSGFLFIMLAASNLSFGQTPQLVNAVSNPLANRDLTISPDGILMLSTLQSFKREVSAIIILQKKDGEWSNPEIASFSGQYSDLEPAFSPDGKRLYFASNRPTPEQPDKTDYDIWYVERKDGGWSAPVHLPEIINTTANEFYPSVANNGSIYFTASYEDSKGTEDIYVSTLKDGSYQKPVSLGEGVNSKTYEFNAFVAPDESYLIFSSYGRSDDLGGGDLYISKRDANGNWLEAEHFPEGVNSKVLDYCPFVDNKGNLYFTSARPVYIEDLTYERILQRHGEVENGLENIYMIKLSEVTELK